MSIHALSRAAVLGLAMALSSTASAQTLSDRSPTVQAMMTNSYSFQLGDLRITALSDGTVPQDLHKLLMDTTQSEVDSLLQQSFLQNPVEASINVYLIEDGARRILVDTGAGQLFGPGFGGKLLDGLEAIGIEPADITDILITHVHTDHTGGLVADGQPVFPNATVHVGAPDTDFFLDASNAEKTGYAMQYFDEAAKTIGVVDKAGQVAPFSGTETVLPGIVATIHPGHTPGSAFYKVTSKDESIVFVGDIVHVAAVQFPEPRITIAYDVSPEQARSVRMETFDDIAGSRQLIAAPHLPFPGVGHIRAKEDEAFGWYPMEYRNRIDN